MRNFYHVQYPYRIHFGFEEQLVCIWNQTPHVTKYEKPNNSHGYPGNSCFPSAQNPDRILTMHTARTTLNLVQNRHTQICWSLEYRAPEGRQKYENTYYVYIQIESFKIRFNRHNSMSNLTYVVSIPFKIGPQFSFSS